jgi:hypothetical protein
MDFDGLVNARGRLFRALHDAVNDGAFALAERSILNELLADPLALDHMLLREAIVRKHDDAEVATTIDLLNDAADDMADVLAGNNSRLARREAIDQVDTACDALTLLLREPPARARQ